MRFAKVYLEITNICNRSCSFCPKTDRMPEFMPFERFCMLCAKLRPFTDYLYFHVMGEPLLHPELKRFLSYAEKLGFQVILTTNGTLLQEKKETLLDAACLRKIHISLHSFEANGPGDLDAYLDACCGFAVEAAQAGKIVHLRLWNRDSRQQCGQNKENNYILNRLHEIFPGIWTIRRGDDCLGPRLYLQTDEIFQWPDLNAERMPDHGCYGLKDQIGVLCDGSVVPCCLDHQGQLKLGNLCEQELQDILNSPRAVAIRAGFASRHAVEELCARCGYAVRFSGRSMNT